MSKHKKSEVSAHGAVTATLQPEFVRVEVAAAFLGVSTATIWRLVNAKKLPKPSKLGKRVSIFRITDLRKLVDHAPLATKPAIERKPKAA